MRLRRAARGKASWCLVVPCYALYYAIIARGDEPEGTFAMQMSFLVVTVGFLFAQSYMFHLAPTVGGMGQRKPGRTPRIPASWRRIRGRTGRRAGTALRRSAAAPFGNQPGPVRQSAQDRSVAAAPRVIRRPRGIPRAFTPSRVSSIIPSRKRLIPFDDWVKQTLAKQGDRAVAVVSFGIPLNADPARKDRPRRRRDRRDRQQAQRALRAPQRNELEASIGAGDRWTTFLWPRR